MIKDKYMTVLKEGITKYEEKKSIFISSVAPVSSEQEALDYIKKKREEYKDASHNTYGYFVIGNQEYSRYSDDGEPSGTAGLPIMDTIIKRNIRNLVIVVTRYFGGKQLGAGGLIRAYSKSASIGIDVAIPVYKKLFNIISIKIEYTLLGKLQYFFEQEGYTVKDIEYGDKVKVYVYVPNDEEDEFINRINDSTNGKIEEIASNEKVYLHIDENNKIILENNHVY